MVRRSLLLWPAVCLVLMGFMLYAQRQRFGAISRPEFLQPHDDAKGAPAAAGDTGQHKPPPEDKHEPAAGEAHDAPPPAATTSSKNVLPEATKSAYIKAIMDPAATHLPRLSCPALNTTRYAYLQAPASTVSTPLPIQYFFALDLRQCVALLPRLISSLAETMRFLGPSRCALSIVEGNSVDGTGEVLASLRPTLEALGVTYHFTTTPIDPTHGDRIAALAHLRNLALAPLLNAPEPTRSANTTIAFLNDVAICPEDILELLHQQAFLQADMVCGMDWTYVGRDPTFYDVWIARGMGGDSFFNIPADGNWDSAWNLFWNDAATQTRFAAKKPFQVFSCWNGGAVFKAAPL
ncbi:alpha-1 3-mannosyltransferase, partial [Staphylotrichum tortipilum]